MKTQSEANANLVPGLIKQRAALFKELEELRWFVKHVNQYVVPGETDTQDAVLKIVKERGQLIEERELLLKVVEAARNIGMNWRVGAPYGGDGLDEALSAYDAWKTEK